MEQFKNSVPSHIAVYISEHKVRTAAEAAALADVYVLTHRCDHEKWARDDVGYKGDSGMSRVTGKWEKRTNPHLGKSERATWGQMQFDSAKICNFCKGRMCAECALSVEYVETVISHCQRMEVSERCSLNEPNFSAFVSGGCVSLVGSDVTVPAKILRDTAAFDSYILSSVLPFSDKSSTGVFVLMRGMGLNVLPVPLHKLVLNCGLVQGEVAMGVCPAMPIAGADIILGNGLAGRRIWANLPHPIVTSSPSVTGKPDESFSWVFTALVVTQAISHAEG